MSALIIQVRQWIGASRLTLALRVLCHGKIFPSKTSKSSSKSAPSNTKVNDVSRDEIVGRSCLGRAAVSGAVPMLNLASTLIFTLAPSSQKISSASFAPARLWERRKASH